MDGPGIESRWIWGFRTCPDRPINHTAFFTMGICLSRR